jgi:hypothetical protein
MHHDTVRGAENDGESKRKLIERKDVVQKNCSTNQRKGNSTRKNQARAHQRQLLEGDASFGETGASVALYGDYVLAEVPQTSDDGYRW